MTSLLAVPITPESSDPDEVNRALDDAGTARSLGADLVEWRLDSLFHGAGDDAGEAAALRLIAESPLPCIATIRSPQEGGHYDGDDDARIALYERLGTADTPPRYIDVEWSTLSRSANLAQKVRLVVEHDSQHRDVATSLICSAHDFAGRPADLLRRLEAMRAEPAAKIIKIAFAARTIRDNLEFFDLLAARDRPTIALGMGEAGLLSRVLAPKFGAFLTFAALNPQSTSAPGQPTVEEMLNRYRFRAINRATKVLGVLGWPVSHSLSPDLHNAGFDAIGFDAVDLPMPIAPEWEAFKATVGELIAHEPLDFIGASVTIPHKGHLVRFARENHWDIDEATARIGAANTLAQGPDGAWMVRNTDALAIAQCLTEAQGRQSLAGESVAILGAGGAARAAAVACADLGAEVRIVNRTIDKAEAMIAELSLPQGIHVHLSTEEDLRSAPPGVVINCTPVGMSTGPAPNDAPLADATLDALSVNTLVFDTVYAPIQTPLIRSAEARSLRTITGDSMFIRQAQVQFGMWAGQPAPAGLFERVLTERLAGSIG
ncbi:MAG: type I 3-dehydroquinate dehydratase [Phycisphaeraceae bacterium]|nr:type I 3-dehydroquinate dehydratase [Phycisphaeraceae bacterium]MCB9848754.1 type I 3-dehydroquinate dehydratase [Phycisphaeraceae bacterium]